MTLSRGAHSQSNTTLFFGHRIFSLTHPSKSNFRLHLLPITFLLTSLSLQSHLFLSLYHVAKKSAFCNIYLQIPPAFLPLVPHRTPSFLFQGTSKLPFTILNHNSGRALMGVDLPIFLPLSIHRNPVGCRLSMCLSTTFIRLKSLACNAYIGRQI